MNWGIIITIEALEISTIDINVKPKDAHLGIENISLIFPVIVQSAIATIIEANKSMNISFKLHKINMEIINAAIARMVFDFNLDIYLLLLLRFLACL